jgi:hypothetical protein
MLCGTDLAARQARRVLAQRERAALFFGTALVLCELVFSE